MVDVDIVQDKEKESLVDRLNNLENYYADSLLSDDLKEVYAQIQLNCADFRENIFFKNVAIIEFNLGKSSGAEVKGREASDKEHADSLKEIKTYEQIMKEYSEKDI